MDGWNVGKGCIQNRLLMISCCCIMVWQRVEGCASDLSKKRRKEQLFSHPMLMVATLYQKDGMHNLRGF